MFSLNKMFWNETEHVHLQAEVRILETRLSLGFTDSQWEASLQFSLKLNLDSEWLSFPCPVAGARELACLVFALSTQERQEEGEKIAWVFYKTCEKWFWDH